MGSKQTLENLWSLSDTDSEVRIASSNQLLKTLESAERKEKEYVFERLMKGLLSSGKGARQGFAAMLTTILQESDDFELDFVLKKAEKIIVTPSFAGKQEAKDLIFAKIFFTLVLCRSNRIKKASASVVKKMTQNILDMSSKKNWLPPLCSLTLSEIIKSTSSDVFKSTILPMMEKHLSESNPLSSASDLMVGLALFERTRSEGVEYSSLLLELGSVFTQSDAIGALKETLQETTLLHPQIHVFWSAFLNFVRDMIKATEENGILYFKAFWTDIMMSFFESSPRRKFLGFHVFRKIIQSFPAEFVSIVLNEDFLSVFAECLRHKNAKISLSAKEAAASLVQVCAERKELCLPILSQFFHISFDFDKKSRYSVVKNIMNQLSAQDIISSLSTLESSAEVTCREVDRVFSLLKHPKAVESDDCFKSGFTMLLKFALDADELVNSNAKSRFTSLLNDYLRNFDVFALIDEFVTKQKQFSKEQLKTRKKLNKLVQSLAKKDTLTDSQKQSLMHMVGYLLLSDLFQENNDSAVEDARIALKKLDSGSLEGLDECLTVCIDIILSLLSHPSSLYRKWSQGFIKSFSAHIPQQSIDEMVGILSASEEPVDQEEDEEEIEDEDVEEDEEEKNELEVTVASDHQVDEEEEDIDMTTASPEDMQKEEDHLVTYFKLRQESKRAKKDSETHQRNFKLRVVDLLEMFVKQDESMKSFALVFPLIESMKSNSRFTKDALVLSKLGQVFTRLVSKKQIEDIDDEKLMQFLVKVKEGALSCKDTSHMEWYRKSFCFFFRFLVKGSDDFYTSKVLHTVHSHVMDPMLSDFITKKRTVFTEAFFADSFNAYPLLGYANLKSICEKLKSASDEYIFTQAFLLIQNILRHKKYIDTDWVADSVFECIPIIADALKTGLPKKTARTKSVLKSCKAVLQIFSPPLDERATESVSVLRESLRSIDIPENSSAKGLLDDFDAKVGELFGESPKKRKPSKDSKEETSKKSKQ